MALEVTHIRAALDLKDDLGVKDIDAYLLGSIYPDSRYVTKIDRKLTHDDKFINKEFVGDDDFKKGWVAHLIFDKAFHKEQGKISLEAKKLKKKEDVNWWAFSTAVKIVGDIQDFNAFNVNEYINFSNYENPNKEDVEAIEKYYSEIKSIYKNKKKMNPKDYFFIFDSWGIENNISSKIIKKAEELLNNKVTNKNILDLYSGSIKEARKYLKKEGL